MLFWYFDSLMVTVWWCCWFGYWFDDVWDSFFLVFWYWDGLSVLVFECSWSGFDSLQVLWVLWFFVIEMVLQLWWVCLKCLTVWCLWQFFGWWWFLLTGFGCLKLLTIFLKVVFCWLEIRLGVLVYQFWFLNVLEVVLTVCRFVWKWFLYVLDLLTVLNVGYVWEFLWFFDSFVVLDFECSLGLMVTVLDVCYVAVGYGLTGLKIGLEVWDWLWDFDSAGLILLLLVLFWVDEDVGLTVWWVCRLCGYGDFC